MPKDPICGMDVDESTNLKLTLDSETYYFCSQHCLTKFVKEKGINEKQIEVCTTCEISETKWYKNKIVIVTSILLILSGLSYFVTFLEAFRKSLWMYFRTIWWAILLGLFIGGIIDHFVPRKYISKILSGSPKRTIFYSAILGFFMSVCSHGILAL